MDEMLQAKLGVAPLPELGRSLKTVVPCPDPGHPPPQGSGMAQQDFSQFNAGLATQPVAAEPQCPHYTGPIGNHPLRLPDHPAELGVAAGRHGHLGIEGHPMATSLHQLLRCPEQVRGQVYRETQEFCLRAVA